MILKFAELLSFRAENAICGNRSHFCVVSMAIAESKSFSMMEWYLTRQLFSMSWVNANDVRYAPLPSATLSRNHSSSTSCMPMASAFINLLLPLSGLAATR